jgi:hypothetical protein
MSLIDKSALPPILYKYRFWSDTEKREKEKTVLTHNQLYFSKPSEFWIKDEFKLHFEDNVPIERIKKYIKQTMSNMYQPNDSDAEIEKDIEDWYNKKHISERIRKYLRQTISKLYPNDSEVRIEEDVEYWIKKPTFL